MEKLFLQRMEQIKEENVKFFSSHSEANDIWIELKNIVQIYLSGRQSDAAQKMYVLFFSDIDKIATSFLNKDKYLFRMRSSGIKMEEFTKEEMYHIPFEKNYLVGNERFSLSGFPSLYLGASSYVCWTELGCPNIDNVTLGIFKTNRYIRIIDLTYNGASGKKNPLRHCLSLASTMPVLHKGEVFKPEYIIPQLLLQGLVQFKHDNPERVTDFGIKYTSTHYSDDDLWFERNDSLFHKFTNYVFPPLRYQERGVSTYLKSLLECKESINYKRFMLCVSNRMQQKFDGEPSTYELSDFGRLEKYLRFRANLKMLENNR